MAHKDFNQPLRKAIFEALNHQIQYEASEVPVHDQKQRKGYDNTNYVIIGNITSSDNRTFQGWSRIMSFDLDIVTKTTNAISSLIADTIAGQIFEILMPDIGLVGVVVPTGFNYINLRLDSDRYIDFELTDTSSLLRRILGFNIQVDQI